jgi:hypothetical protein
MSSSGLDSSLHFLVCWEQRDPLGRRWFSLREIQHDYFCDQDRASHCYRGNYGPGASRHGNRDALDDIRTGFSVGNGKSSPACEPSRKGLVRPQRKSERRIHLSLPFLRYSAPGGLRQVPGRGVESLESARSYARSQNLSKREAINERACGSDCWGWPDGDDVGG